MTTNTSAMKNYKILLSVCALLIFWGTARADDRDAKKLTLKYALTTFVDAFSRGETDAFAELLDEHAKMTSSRGTSTVSYSKNDIIYMLKNTRGIEQNCKTSSSYIEVLPGMVKVKVTMVYSSFTKNNYVTMKQTKVGWRITNISSIFE